MKSQLNNQMKKICLMIFLNLLILKAIGLMLMILLILNFKNILHKMLKRLIDLQELKEYKKKVLKILYIIKFDIYIQIIADINNIFYY